MAAKKRTEVKKGDVLTYVRQNSGMTTAEGFAMRPGVPVAVGDDADVTVAFGQMLVDDGYYVIEGEWLGKEVEEATKAKEEAAKAPVVTAFEPEAVSEATAAAAEEEAAEKAEKPADKTTDKTEKPANADDSGKEK